MLALYAYSNDWWKVKDLYWLMITSLVLQSQHEVSFFRLLQSGVGLWAEESYFPKTKSFGNKNNAHVQWLQNQNNDEFNHK